MKTHSFTKFVFGIVFTLIASSAFGAIEKVPRGFSDFTDYQMDRTMNVRVPTARVVLANYQLIARDFPAQQQQFMESEAQWKARVDRWLVSETGYILDVQANQQVVNSPIPVDSADKKEAFRPPKYGRAHLIPVAGGLMDSKGVGSKTPSHMSHGNGLATLGEMIREFIMEKVVSEVVEHEKVGKTVGCYAVIDYGFDVVNADGSRSRAGYILRQAHQRSANHNSSLSKNVSFLLEKVYRKYGLTSSDETYVFRHNGHTESYNFDYTNIQGTNNPAENEIIDFGAYRIVDHFKFKLISNDYSTLMDVHDPGFVQPDPVLRIPMEPWEQVTFGDISIDKVYVRALDLAASFAKGTVGREALEELVGTTITPIREKFRTPPHLRTCRALFP